MDNITHVCFSAPASGNLKYALKNNLIKGKNIIGFYDSLSEGQIGDFSTLDERIKWFANISERYEILEEDTYEFKRSYSRFNRKIRKITDKDVLYLWYGECGCDICGMMYALEILKEKHIKIYLINVSNIVDEFNSSIFISKSVGTIDVNCIPKYIKIKTELNKEKYEEILKQWEVLKKENKMLRIFKNGKIASIEENYIDIDILKHTENEFRKSARIVGSVLAVNDDKISDDYIFWRVKKLVELGDIEYKGKFGLMREMEIKISSKGLKHLENNPQAMKYWEERQREEDREMEYKKIIEDHAILRERVKIAKNLTDILEVEVIAERVGLSVGQVKNLKN